MWELHVRHDSHEASVLQGATFLMACWWVLGCHSTSSNILLSRSSVKSSSKYSITCHLEVYNWPELSTMALGRMHACHLDNGIIRAWASANQQTAHSRCKSLTARSCQGTVTSKTVAMPNLDTACEAHCNHPWELRLALVETNKVQALGYESVPWLCHLAQPPWRYASSKTVTPLQQFCTF